MHGNNRGSRSEEESKKESEPSESDKDDEEDVEEEETLITQLKVGEDVSTETEHTRELNAKTQKEESPPQTNKMMSMAMQTRKQKLLYRDRPLALLKNCNLGKLNPNKNNRCYRYHKHNKPIKELEK
eukprot:3800981-Ditylum_brightwellii.AAC.1